MEYSLGGVPLPGPGATRQETPLSQIAEDARAAERIGDLIEGFLSRCTGSERDCVNANADLEIVPNSHFANLTRLAGMLDRAEKLAQELGNIG